MVEILLSWEGGWIGSEQKCCENMWNMWKEYVEKAFVGVAIEWHL